MPKKKKAASIDATVLVVVEGDDEALDLIIPAIEDTLSEHDGITVKFAANLAPADEEAEDEEYEDEELEDDEEYEDEEAEDEEDEESDLYDEADLKKMKVAELREVAEDFGIDTDGVKKPGLIDAILEAQEEDLEDEEEDEEYDEEDEGEWTLEDLEDMSLAELRDTAAEEGIKVPPAARKSKKKMVTLIAEEWGLDE